MIPRGVIGQIGGVSVFVSDRVTTTAADGTNPATYNALMVRRGSLGLLYKRRPLVETDRDILARTTVVTTNVHYATHRLDDEGIVVLKTGGGGVMLLRRYHPRGNDSPDEDGDEQTAEDEQTSGPPAKKPTARSAAPGKSTG